MEVFILLVVVLITMGFILKMLNNLHINRLENKPLKYADNKRLSKENLQSIVTPRSNESASNKKLNLELMLIHDGEEISKEDYYRLWYVYSIEKYSRKGDYLINVPELNIRVLFTTNRSKIRVITDDDRMYFFHYFFHYFSCRDTHAFNGLWQGNLAPYGDKDIFFKAMEIHQDIKQEVERKLVRERKSRNIQSTKSNFTYTTKSNNIKNITLRSIIKDRTSKCRVMLMGNKEDCKFPKYEVCIRSIDDGKALGFISIVGLDGKRMLEKVFHVKCSLGRFNVSINDYRFLLNIKDFSKEKMLYFTFLQIKDEVYDLSTIDISS